MTIAGDLFESVVFKKQAALKVKATSADAQILRRVSSDLNMGRSLFESNEINASQQLRDARLGVKAVTGTISGELSPGTYQEPIASVLRGTFASAVVGGPDSDITVSGTTSTITLTSSATATFITDGLRVGKVVRITGLAEPGNNDNNILITSLTELVLIGVFLNGTMTVAESAGSAFTITEVGKSVTTPTFGHVRDYYTIEHVYSDITQSEQFVDSVFSGFNLGVTTDGMTTISLPILALDQDTSTSAYFTAPTSATTTGITAGPNGSLFINGVAQATVTGVSDITVDGQYAAQDVIGSVIGPDILPGVLKANGTLTVLFQDTTERDLFLNETEVAVLLILTTDNADTADFVAITLPKVKFSDAAKSVANNALLQTMPFQALENTDITEGLPLGTLIYQDSQAV
jgi:hypothetical protein